MMRVYLIQHGEARSENEDPQRSLTTRGQKEVVQVAGAAQRMGLRCHAIYHSGKQRARQTAEIMAQALGSPVSQVPGLAPLDDVSPWAETFARGKKDLMLVGHLPFLQKLASLLIVGREDARPVLFRYGAVVCLELYEDSGWGVRWILTPEMVPE
jgi:phosphohistidine phosphatase